MKKKENLIESMQKSAPRGVLSVIDTDETPTQETTNEEKDILTQLSEATSYRAKDGRKRESKRTAKDRVKDGDIRQTFILSEQVNDVIHAIAEREGQRLGHILNKALSKYIEEYESKENVSITWKAPQDVTIKNK